MHSATTSAAPRSATRSHTCSSEPPVASMGSQTMTRRPREVTGQAVEVDVGAQGLLVAAQPDVRHLGAAARSPGSPAPCRARRAGWGPATRPRRPAAPWSRAPPAYRPTRRPYPDRVATRRREGSTPPRPTGGRCRRRWCGLAAAPTRCARTGWSTTVTDAGMSDAHPGAPPYTTSRFWALDIPVSRTARARSCLQAAG